MRKGKVNGTAGFPLSIVTLLTLALVVVGTVGCEPAPKTEVQPVATQQTPVSTRPEKRPSLPIADFGATNDLLPDVDSIISVDQLPKNWQFTKAEMAAAVRNVNRKPDIAVDRAKCQIVECTDCAVVARGVVLFPPFCVVSQDDKIYVNGYEAFPGGSLASLYPAKWKAERKRKMRPSTPCVSTAEDNRVTKVVDELAQRTFAEKRDKAWLQDQLQKANVTVERLVVSEGTIFVSLQMTCHSFGFEFHSPAKLAAMAAAESQIDTSGPLNVALVTKHIRDRTLLFSGVSMLPRSIAVLDKINDILTSNLDERIKVYRLYRIININRLAFLLLANYSGRGVY